MNGNNTSTHIKWHREESVTPEKYKDLFLKNNTNNNGGTNVSKNAKAYEAASDIRKFEIGLYWQRTAYFWAFITVIYTAYYHVLTMVKEGDKIKIEHGTLPLVILSFLGLFFSVSWLLSNKASKHWQENWEAHMDLLEDDITGPLYKTYLSEHSYSVSKINLNASRVISIFAALLLGYESYSFVNKLLLSFEKMGVIVWIVWGAFVCLVMAGYHFYKKLVSGNDDQKGEFVFMKKEYEESDRGHK